LLRPAIGVTCGPSGFCATSSAGFWFEHPNTNTDVVRMLTADARTINRRQRNILDRAMNPLVNVSDSALRLHRSGHSLWDGGRLV
jgi:hypothetical protein